jgi:hypothetical protein
MNVGSKETLGQTQNHPSGKWEINDSHKIHKDDGVFSIYYKKNHNLELFNSLENSELQLHNIQNYITIYENFFLLKVLMIIIILLLLFLMKKIIVIKKKFF